MSIECNYNGIVIIRAKNSLFDCASNGMSRTLPSGKFFATDEALKYCIKEYLRLFKDKDIFFSRYKHIIKAKDNVQKSRYDTFKQNYENKLNKKIPKNNSEILEDLKSFIDIRIFGINSTIKDLNISLMGPVQINYGIDQFNDETSELLGLEAYYVYDVSVNKENARYTGMTNNDLNLLKDALKYSVNKIASDNIYGCHIIYTLWFKNKENKIYNNLNSLVNIFKDKQGFINIDYSKVLSHINLTKDSDELEIYNMNNEIFKEKFE